MQKPSTTKGTRDFGPKEAAKRQYITKKISEVFHRYGFLPIETPALEQLTTLQGKYGDEGDQLLFKILNSGDFLKNCDKGNFENSSSLLPKITEKGLRYDLTVPFARFVTMNQHEINFPFKRYQIAPVWRADRPQRGRYREFHQCDADIIGTNSSWNEIELLLMIHDVFQNLNFSDFVVHLNHRSVLAGIAEYCGLKGKETAFCVVLDKIDKIGKMPVSNELMELGGDMEKVTIMLDLMEAASSTEKKIEQLGALIGEENPGIIMMSNFFTTIKEDFPDSNLLVELDFSLARGLSYYTGMIYEVKPTTVKMGSICGGGRYDDLTGIFGLPNISGIGISFGLDRIYDVLDELDLFPDTSLAGPKVLFLHFDEATFRSASRLVMQMRLKGIASDIYPDQVKLKKQLSFANKAQIPFTITIGEEEISADTYTLKDMNGNQNFTGNFESIIRVLKEK